MQWSNYSAKAIAQIQARGMPIDMPLWNLVQENKLAVIGELLRQLDPSHGDDDPIYDGSGAWSYDRFERWLVRNGVSAWPRLASGRLDTRRRRLQDHVPPARRRGAARACATVSASSSRRSCRSVATGAIVPRCFHSARRPGATRTVRACTTRTPACARFMVFPPRHDRRLPRLAHARGRNCRRPVRRRSADARLRRRRHLSRLGADVRPHR